MTAPIVIPEKCYKNLSRILYEICLPMERRGIRIDRARVARIQQSIENAKKALFPLVDGKEQPFNPRSAKESLEWFSHNGIQLSSWNKKDLVKALERLSKAKGFLSIKDLLASDDVDLSASQQVLINSYRYKDSGKGTDPWFGDKYFDPGKDIVHPRLNPTGASTGRFSSSSPNFQNVSSHGWGKEVKKCVIPLVDGNKFLSSDAGQLELRIMLDNAGVESKDIGRDAFAWLASKAPEDFERARQLLAFDTARDVAKSIAHGANYLEGLDLLDYTRFASDYTQKAIKAGALIVFEDWIYCDMLVAFTGGNLSERLFGDKSFENRKKALDIIFGIYFKNFPMINQLHRKILKDAECGFIQLRTGEVLPLLSSPRDNAKQAAAMIGQGEGASYMRNRMLDCLDAFPNLHLTMQVHDELLREVPGGWLPDNELLKVNRFESCEKTFDFGDLLIPFKSKVGPNWGDVKAFANAGELL